MLVGEGLLELRERAEQRVVVGCLDRWVVLGTIVRGDRVVMFEVPRTGTVRACISATSAPTSTAGGRSSTAAAISSPIASRVR
jgi:hypothetical protein